MAARPSWEGFLRFNLISVPVKAYNAASAGGGKIGFHLVHKSCHSRIRYKKVCPIHGEVDNDQIVSGYEVAKGEYAVVEARERGALRSQDDKVISVAAFIHADAVDLLYYSGRCYYLVPDGKVAQKPYTVLADAMRDENRHAIAQVVFAGRVQLVLIRPYDEVLAMAFLNYESQIKQPSQFAGEVGQADVSTEERKLAETLIETATTDKLDLGRYKDEYMSKLARLIERKGKHSRHRASQESGEEPVIINLMDALRQSLARARKGRSRSSTRRSTGSGKRGKRSPTRRKTG